MQSMNAFNQCYFSSNHNKKAVEQAVMSQAYQSQIQGYAMMNLSKYVNQQTNLAPLPIDPNHPQGVGALSSILSMGPSWARSEKEGGDHSGAADVPLVREVQPNDDNRDKKLMFTPFKPLELDLYIHRYDKFLAPAPEEQGRHHSDEESASCSHSESDFKSIEKNIENEILNFSFEESLPMSESEDFEEETDSSDASEANSIGSKILSRKRLRVFDQITNDVCQMELHESHEPEKFMRPK